MIRIAYIIDHLHVGGAQQHLLRVVENLDRQVYVPEIWTAASDPGELAPVFEARGIPVHSFGIRQSLLRAGTLRAIIRVARDFQDRRVHIVHGYLFEGNFLAALVGRLGRIPVTFVAKRSLDRYARIDRRIAAWLSNLLADRVLVNAKAVGDIVAEHERCPPEKIRMIPNGVELPTPRPPRGTDRDTPLVGMVGRLGWKKGYEFALEAFADLKKRIPGLRVEIIGEGDLRESLTNLRAKLGLEEAIDFLGRRDDVGSQLPRYDCYALSSVIEGMPNALLEAMASGVPVVTTDAGGSSEIVVDEVSGLVVPTRNPTALSNAIGRVLTERGLAERLALAGTARVRKHYSLDAMISAMDAAYRESLQAAGLKVPAQPAEDKLDACEAAAGSLRPAAGGGI